MFLRLAIRLIQSIPSKKAEPFKRWLAQIGKERLDEIENMCTLKGAVNTTSSQVSHSPLQNTSKNIGEKEVGKAGAEFPQTPFRPNCILDQVFGNKQER